MAQYNSSHTGAVIDGVISNLKGYSITTGTMSRQRSSTGSYIYYVPMSQEKAKKVVAFFYIGNSAYTEHGNSSLMYGNGSADQMYVMYSTSRTYSNVTLSNIWSVSLGSFNTTVYYAYIIKN